MEQGVTCEGVTFRGQFSASTRTAPAMSAHLQQMGLRNRSSFLIKRNKQSTGPNKTSRPETHPATNRLIHWKTVGIKPAVDGKGKGIVVVLKKRKPTTSYVRTTVNKNSWATLNSVWHIIRRNKY
ncbi:large ribosomal subunit protein eL28-like [Petaurus breviceps papuanus]|uniref:large ribosomal subunit protein eL28-like n=1 Tax=Petaurus breviceps papuanus TaxID=3040969 RepID=UPI0036DB92F3